MSSLRSNPHNQPETEPGSSRFDLGILKGAESEEPLIHFVHEIDGHRYSGWYHRMAGGRIEVFTRTRRGIAFLGKRSSEDEARRLLEDLVRRDPSIEM